MCGDDQVESVLLWVPCCTTEVHPKDGRCSRICISHTWHVPGKETDMYLTLFGQGSVILVLESE